MAIPPEFNYPDENAFVQQFLIPLLQRLGFSLVVNYHGSVEFGKDLIFAELDRFGHFRYHGLQAKYEGSISLNGIEDLIRDCKQAFENPFTHPQTGSTERISSFYSVTAGTVGPEAAQHYFNSLVRPYGANVRLIQAKDLLTLDRWASAGRLESTTGILSGLLIELRYNEEHVLPLLLNSLKQLLAGTGTWPLWRLRAEAASEYLRHPIMPEGLDVDTVLNYWHLAILCNKEVDLVGQGIFSPENRRALNAQAVEHLEQLRTTGIVVSSAVSTALQSLAPLAGA